MSLKRNIYLTTELIKQLQIYLIRERNIIDKRRANCSQTTGERFAPSVASDGLVRLALAELKGREGSAVDKGAPQR